MDDNKLRFGVGVLVISAIGVGIILVFLFGAFPSVLNRDYILTAVFPSAEGISTNTPVVRDGVRIGRVSSIDLRDEGGVLVTMAMDSGKRLSHRYVPRIGTGNFVTGDAELEFVRAEEPQLISIFGDDRQAIEAPYSDGEFLDYGSKSSSLLEMQDDLQETFDAIQSAGDSIATWGAGINDLTLEVRDVVGQADEKVDLVAEAAVEALEEFQGAMRDVRAIIGNPEAQESLRESLVQIPALLEGAQTVLDSIGNSLDTVERAGAKFEEVGEVAAEVLQSTKTTIESAGATINNLEQFTEPLAERGDELVDQVIRSLSRAETALAQVETFGTTLNNSEGSLKRFLEDDDIYWQVRRTIENIEMATARVRPILDDVRVFTDKIARDPRELGVRGAIGRRPSGSGLK